MYALGFGHTDKGKKREGNEDALLVDNELGLHMVCDGMGGRASGEVASSTAVKLVTSRLQAHRRLLEQVISGEAPYSEVVSLAVKTVHDACAEIHRLATKNPEHAGMGTTLTLLLVLGDKAVMAHVGDTRLYMLRANSIHQLSMDHTMAMELVRKGAITPESVKGSPYEHVLSRAVGTHPSVEVDTLLFDILPADRFLLCTDGLTKYVSSQTNLVPFLDEDIENAPNRLVKFAYDAGGSDNITALAVKIVAYERERETLVEMDTEVNIKIGALSSSFLFSELTMAQLAKVLEVCEIDDFAAAQPVVSEGDINTAMYVVIEGRAELSRSGLVIGQLGPGDLVGETTLLHERPARSTLRATEATRMLRIEGEALKILVQRRSYLGILLLEQLGRRLSMALDRSHAILGDQSLDLSVTHLDPSDLF